MGIHHFDLMRYVFDREPIAVEARTWNPSWGWHRGDAGHTAIFELEGGLIVTHHALGCSVGKQSPWNGEWRIEGPQGSITWEEDQIFRTSIEREHAGREQLPLDQVPPAQDAILQEFLDAVREGREPECSSRDNIRSLAMVFAGIRSDQERRRVEIAELLDE
ncbi:MAG: hypothetical protein KatS3mg115_0381 [Candidatus Poribacteria bacterium]|nr:MAG: hypothetical protein KatS3mg115_0381 [Candidatus Poribacteria bacterium]